jgi:hypothetical protein
VLARGGHFAFLPVCTAEGLRALATIAADVCGQRVSVDRAEVHRRVEAEALEFFNRVLRAIRRSRTLGRLKPQLVPSRADENSQRPAGVDGGVDLHATRCAARNVKRFLSALVKLTATMRALKEGRRLGR